MKPCACGCPRLTHYVARLAGMTYLCAKRAGIV